MTRSTQFDEQRTRYVLAEVCRQTGLPLAGAQLLRHHTNAVYAVGDVVVKIARPPLNADRLRPVVAVTRWLTGQDFPTVGLAGSAAQPLTIAGHAATLWERLDDAQERPITTGELGGLLQRLHQLPEPPVRLPVLDPIASIQRATVESRILTGTQRRLIIGRLAPLAESWQAMDFPLPIGLIQSDPQIRNALRRPDGTAVLADLDGLRIGPREWDIATVAVHCRRFGNGDFGQFVTAYGWDPGRWPQSKTLCQLRELQLIATNARKSAPGTPAAREVHHRLAGLRNGGSAKASWTIL